MAIYKISDLLDSLKSAASEGFEYVDVSEIEKDDDSLETLYLSYIESETFTSDEMVDSVVLPSNYVAPVE